MGGKINHIVNNAGFAFDKSLHTMPDDTFDTIMKIHVRAPFCLIRQAAPYFRLKVYYKSFFYPPYPHFILLYEPSLSNLKTAQSSMYLLLQVCMEALVEPTMPLRSCQHRSTVCSSTFPTFYISQRSWRLHRN